MSNVKITDLPSLTGALSDSLDVLPVVDVSGDATSKMTRAEFFLNVPAITTVGNVGIGVTPSAWGTNYKAIESAGNAAVSLASANVNPVTIASNAYATNVDWFYKTTGVASRYESGLGAHKWFTALSGTAGTAITFTERFQIGTSGQFGIGGSNYGTTGQTIVSAGAAAAPAWGTLPAVGGGTGITSYAIGDLVYASTTTALSKLADVATGNALISGGVGVAPAYGKIGLTTHVSGTLPVANGGTGVTTSTGSGAVVLGTGPTITGAALNGTLGATTASTVAATTVTATTSVLSSGSGGIGYSTGAGVAVTQLTSRTTTTPTTGAKTSGAVTLFTAAAVVNTYFNFTVPNTAIAVTDTVSLSVRGATNTYVAFVTSIVAGTSFMVTMASVAGTASDTPIVNFNIIKGVSA